ncbi:MAG: DUF2442 domain-containing protein [Planctomycetes bacterium]|nr:DUF2442 domain-containing protein [Planctomycetota bacterium]
MNAQKPEWVVTAVKPNQNDYTLLVTFVGGVKKIFDVKPLLNLPILAKLKSPGFFMRAQALHGTVVWDDDTDIAPEHLFTAGVPLDVDAAP